MDGVSLAGRLWPFFRRFLGSYIETIFHAVSPSSTKFGDVGMEHFAHYSFPSIILHCIVLYTHVLNSTTESLTLCMEVYVHGDA